MFLILDAHGQSSNLRKNTQFAVFNDTFINLALLFYDKSLQKTTGRLIYDKNKYMNSTSSLMWNLHNTHSTFKTFGCSILRITKDFGCTVFGKKTFFTKYLLLLSQKSEPK